jgi:folate-binding protein YgfZ
MTILSDEALLRLSGPDAVSFLQGQTTANFANAEPGTCLRGAFCDPKGRILADFLAAIVTPEEILLRIRRPVAEQLAQHLSRYLAFSKASLDALPWSVSANTENSEGSTFARKGDALIVPRGKGLTEYWSVDSEAAGELDSDHFRGREIALGEARIESATVGSYLPQDLNFDLNDAVSFDKGCYTGQEIIARLHYRGTPKRRLYRALLSGAELPAPGTSLYLPEKTQSVGSIVNSGIHPAGIALLVETTDGAIDQGLSIGEAGPVLAAWLDN